jgi:hypothetical protein
LPSDGFFNPKSWADKKSGETSRNSAETASSDFMTLPPVKAKTGWNHGYTRANTDKKYEILQRRSGAHHIFDTSAHKILVHLSPRDTFRPKIVSLFLFLSVFIRVYP